jgi:predicted HTH transcriptional regulator
MIKKATISAEELSSVLGISLRKTKENIAKLKANGFIEGIGAPKGGYWKIIKNN